ncbi:M1 family aminopeptidase [Myxococcus sp. Y35]|uniref:M1 family metallopeptidase n=1 Tax=Pseudomyxococcus flavus TaxID=3115648 RepID=UPI003CEA8B5E
MENAEPARRFVPRLEAFLVRLGHIVLPLLALCAWACAASRPASTSSSPETPVRPPTAAVPVEEAAPVLTPPGLRLPPSVRPVRQTVTLELDPRRESFSGTTDIEIALPQATSEVWLHGEALSVRDAAFIVAGSRVRTSTLPIGDLLVFLPREPVGPGTVTLRVAFTGRALAREGSGIYREEDAGRWYTMTQFQPLAARRAFPCFDEPSFKIPWRLTLRVREEDGAYANAPVEAETHGPDGWKTVRFQTTPPLPSYLVAFAVGPFQSVDAGVAGHHRVPVRMLVPHGRTAEAAWAAQSTPRLLERLEAWFGTPYPYAKLDVLALPGTQGGAMEHPGLITFGAPLMLGPVEGDSLWRQRYFAQTQAHELAHQWFGNLVTPAWWDDLWLNESFADWLAYKAMTQWKPEWRGDVRRVEARGDALVEDRLVSARSIRQPIEAPGDIHAAFDGITYNKGAAVLAMFESWVGPDAFQEGVRRYLDAHARGTATTADFFDALSSATGKDVASAFSSFLDQPGVPRVAMALECPKDAPPRLALEQRRYLPLGSPGAHDVPMRWQVPVCVRYAVKGREGRACTLLSEPTGTLELEGATACPDWVHPNVEGRGYYHAVLRGDALERLTRHGGKGLSVAERRVLLDDAQALVASGDLAVARALALASRLMRPEDPDLVMGAAALVASVRDDFVPRTSMANHARFVQSLFGAQARRLGLLPRPDEGDDLRMLRPRLVWMVTQAGEDAHLRAEARKLALRWLEDRRSLPMDSAHAVLGAAAAGGDAALHLRLLEALRTTTERRERDLLLTALGGFHDAALARASLALLLVPEVDAREALPILFRQLEALPTRAVAFDFLREHFEALRERLPRDIAPWLLSTGGFFCDAEHRKQFASFFEPHASAFEGGERILAQTLERVDLCIAQREALRPGLERFLRRY